MYSVMLVRPTADRQKSIEAKNNLRGTADQTISRLMVEQLQKHFPSKTSCLCRTPCPFAFSWHLPGCAAEPLLFPSVWVSHMKKHCWRSAGVDLRPIHRAALLKKPSGFEKENKNSGADAVEFVIVLKEIQIC